MEKVFRGRCVWHRVAALTVVELFASVLFHKQLELQSLIQFLHFSGKSSLVEVVEVSAPLIKGLLGVDCRV